jgi:hypothetical protein
MRNMVASLVTACLLSACGSGPGSTVRKVGGVMFVGGIGLGAYGIARADDGDDPIDSLVALYTGGLALGAGILVGITGLVIAAAAPDEPEPPPDRAAVASCEQRRADALAKANAIVDVRERTRAILAAPTCAHE